MNNQKRTIVKFAFSFALLAVAYLPTLQWMFDRWMAPESYYGHGFLIPLVSIFLIWQRRKTLAQCKIERSGLGLFIVAVGLLVHVVCAALRIYSLSGFSFVFVLYGLVLFFFGKKISRNMLFPICFLLAMVPLPLVLIGNLTVKLKLFVAQVSTFVLNKIGFPSIRDGSTIRMPNSYILVEAPCSGLRSLISLLTLGLLFAYATKVSYVRKGMLFLSSIPIALFSNVIRIILLAVVNDLYGEKIAMGFFHDFSGFVMFGVAFAGLFGISRILEKGKKNE